MALTAQQLLYLKAADQRFQAHVAVFPAYEPTIVAPTTSDAAGTLLTPTPLIRLAPRYSTVNNGATIDIYAGDSYLRGGGAAGTKNWSTDAGSLSGATGDTVTFTAPGTGSGIATITVTCANGNGTSTSYAFVQYPTTTYDGIVAEIASIGGSLSQHGWKATLRVRGDASAFALGKGLLIHIDDTWDGTASNFGGYKYAAGVLFGYISAAEYFEDWSGETWLGVEVSSPWWLLSRTRVAETWWGYTSQAGKLYITNFAPVDAIWKLVQDISDFSAYHDCVLWYDQNTIDDLIIDQSDLATIFADVMERTLSLAFCDRYGSLMCIPDPDVRADEWWGTPDPWLTLTPEYVSNYTINYYPYQVNTLTVEAVDSAKLGLYAVSLNPTALGDTRSIRTLICDQAITLASWAVQKRAQANRQWSVNAGLFLNHIADLCNFVTVNLTAPGQANGLTASGQTWINSINYRPDIAEGSWQGGWELLQRTEGVGEAETGSVSGWGGAGQGWSGNAPYTGSALIGSGLGGWGSATSASGTWCYTFDFSASNGGWMATSAIYYSWGGFNPWPANYTAGVGWSAQTATHSGSGLAAASTFSGAVLLMRRDMPACVITAVDLYLTMDGPAVFGHAALLTNNTGWLQNSALEIPAPDDGTGFWITQNLSAPVSAYHWSGSAYSSNYWIMNVVNYVGNASAPPSGFVVVSATFKGPGTNPFGGDNC